MSKGKVLIADDEVALVEILASRLSRLNYQVLKAYNGSDALELLEREKPDLVLLDVIMPGMDGHDVLAAIRKRKDDLRLIPVIVMSGKFELEERFRTDEIFAFVPKPIDVKALIKQIEIILV